MESTREIGAAPGRLLPGAYGWWFVGDRRSFLLGPGAVGPDRQLGSAAVRSLAAGGAWRPMRITAYSLTVLTTTTCNLGCGYCFQNTAQDPAAGNRPPRIDARRLTRPTARAVIDFAAARMAQSGLDRLNLHLFGGEPLLNPDGCRELLRLGSEHNLSGARMTTNGVLLTPVLAKELHAAGLRTVQVTFDGDRDDHDTIRVRRSGGGSFDTILANLERATAVTDLAWSLRINVSHHNAAGIATLLDRLAARLDPARCLVDLQLVHDKGIGYQNELLRSGALARSFLTWLTTAVDRGFRVGRPRARVVCPACSFRNGKYGAVVNADGTLYSCWESAGKPGWEVGTVRTGYLTDEKYDDRWVGCGHADEQPESTKDVERFRDAVDAGLLDHLYAVGKL